jgi:hypothetical protein
MYTLPAAPPPVESVAAVRPAALHNAGPAAVVAWAAGAAGGGVFVGAADAVWVVELLGEDAGVLEVWDCGVPPPQPLSRSAAAAAAVVSTRPLVIR